MDTADGKLKEYQYANDAVTFVKDISIGDGYSEITADETGNLYVSSKLSNNAFLRIKDGNIEELAKDIGPVKMQRSGNVGISALFDIKDCSSRWNSNSTGLDAAGARYYKHSTDQ